MATLQLQDLRQYNGDLTENDLMLFKIKRRVDMPADEDMGVRYSQFLQQINLERFVKKAGDTMFGDLVFQNNRGIFGTTTTGASRSLFKLTNADAVAVGNTNNPLILQSLVDPKVTTQSGTYTLYHTGNANISTIDWSARNITAHQTLSVLGESTMANLSIKKLSAIYGYDAGNLKVRMIGIDADDDVAVGVTTKRFGILVKDPNEIWAVQEEGNPAKQWRVLTTGNFTSHLNNTYVLKTQTVNGKALTGNITLSATDVKALPITGGTLTSNLEVSGTILSTGRIQTANASTGNIWIGGNEAGYAEVAGRHKDAVDYGWGSSLRFYLDNTWRIGDKKVFHEGFLPTPSALNVYTKDETYSQEQINLKYHLWVRDMRTADIKTPKPSQLQPNSLQTWFNDEDTPAATWYSGLTVSGWDTKTNYASWQLCSFSGTGSSDSKLWFRTSAGSDTWGEWARVYTTLDRLTAEEIGALPATNYTVSVGAARPLTLSSNNPSLVFHETNTGKKHWMVADASGIRLQEDTTEGRFVFQWTSSGVQSHQRLFKTSGVMCSEITDSPYKGQYGWNLTHAGDTQIGITCLARPQGSDQYAGFGVHSSGQLYAWNTKSNKGYAFVVGEDIMSINRSVHLKGQTNEIISDSQDSSFRMVRGAYGAFWRQDGTNLYLMLTNQNDPYGIYNSHRPFRVNLATGRPFFEMGGFFNGGVNLPVETLITFNNSAEWASGVGWSIGEESATGNLMFHRYNNGAWQNAPFRLFNDLTVWCEANVNANDVYIRSDESLKTNLKPLENSLTGIMQLEPTEYDKRLVDSDVYDMHEEGLIAQAVEKIFPNAVHTDTSSGLKSLKPYALIARLIGAIQEQQKMIEELKNGN